MAPTIIFTEKYPTNALSPNITLSDFLLLETTPNTQGKTTTPNSAAAVNRDTPDHQQITMDPIITDITRQYFYACERTGHLTDSCLEQVLTFLPH